MGIKLLDRTWNYALGANVDEYLMDSVADLALLPKAATGSTAFAPVEGRKYVCDASGEWVEDKIGMGNPAGGGSGGSGGVSSWNDLTDKPFYEETHTVEVLPETTKLQVVNKTKMLVEGETYIVTWDGVKYRCNAFTIPSIEGWVCLGNFKEAGAADTGEPFAIYECEDTDFLGLYVIRAASGHTWSIDHVATVIHRVDQKFLPEALQFGEETHTVEVLPETTLDTQNGFYFIYAVEKLLLGETYFVNWNGTEYECQARISDIPYISSNAVVLGNESTPFLCWYAPSDGVDRASYGMQALDGSTSVTISIYQQSTVIHPIEGKYLPKALQFGEEGGLVEVLAETTFSSMFAECDELSKLVVGKTYLVTFNGEKYTCVAKSFERGSYYPDNDIPNAGNYCAGIYLGSGAAADIEDAGNGEPFSIAYVSEAAIDGGTVGGIIAAVDGSSTMIISIYQDNAVIHPIDSKFLPKALQFGEETGVVEVLAETTVPVRTTFDESGIDVAPLGLKEGKQYTVIVDGVEYREQAWALNVGEYSIVALGAGSIIGLSNDSGVLEDGGAFAIVEVPGSGCLIRIAKNPSEVSDMVVSILGEGTVIKPIEGKYLPKSVPYVQENALLAETVATGITHPTFGQMWAIYGGAPDLKAGETYTVTYNGVDYKCVCQPAVEGLINDPNAVAMGNFSVVGGENTGEPFAMLVSYAYQEVDIVDLSGAASVKVEITGTTVRKLDNRCLDLAWLPTATDGKGEEICPEVEKDMISYSGIHLASGTDTVGIELEANKTYIVVWEGTEYKCTAVGKTSTSYDGYVDVYLGNRALVSDAFGGTGEDTGEPFLITRSYSGHDAYTIGFFAGDGGEESRITRTVGIYAVDKIPNKLPAEFLPDDATSFTLVSPGGKKFSITVSDDGALTVTEVTT